MHQIRSPLRLRPRPRWGSLQRSPDTLAVFKGPTSIEKEGTGGRGKGEAKRSLGKEKERTSKKAAPSNWKLWIRQWRRGEGRMAKRVWLEPPRTFLYFKHW